MIAWTPRRLALLGAIAAVTITVTGVSTGQVRAETPAPSPSVGTGAVPPPATATPSPIPKASLCAHLPLKLPPTIDGLPLTPEQSCTSLTGTPHPAAIDAMSLYSLRRSDTLLLATLQASRFSPRIDVSSADAQAAIVKGLSTTIPAVLRVGNTIVYQTQTSTLTMQIWFRGRYLFVLAIRDLVGKPRSMLRELLAIQP